MQILRDRLPFWLSKEFLNPSFSKILDSRRKFYYFTYWGGRQCMNSQRYEAFIRKFRSKVYHWYLRVLCPVSDLFKYIQKSVAEEGFWRNELFRTLALPLIFFLVLPFFTVISCLTNRRCIKQAIVIKYPFYSDYTVEQKVRDQRRKRRRLW